METKPKTKEDIQAKINQLKEEGVADEKSFTKAVDDLKKEEGSIESEINKLKGPKKETHEEIAEKLGIPAELPGLAEAQAEIDKNKDTSGPDDKGKEGKEPTPEEKGVEESRSKYLEALTKYNKERGAWRKVITTLGMKEGYKNSKLANVEKVKAEYDKARVELGKKMNADKKAELEKMGLHGEEINKQLFEYRNGEIFKIIHLDEYKKLQDERAEKLPPERKTLLKKAWNASWKVFSAYSDLGKKGGTLFKIPIPKSGGKKFDVTWGFLAKSAGTAAFFTLTAGGGWAMWGARATKGLTSGITAGITNKFIKNKQEKNLDRFKIDIGNKKSDLQNKFTSGNISLVEYKKEFEKINKMVERKERIQMATRAAASVLVGVGTSYGMSHAMDNGTETTGNNKKTVETKTTTIEQTTPAPATDSIPKEAMIDAEHNVGITYALKSQLEANSDLAHRLGYDVAPNKAQFLADLGKKLGYINEHGDVRVQADMGAAYVLGADFDDTPYVHEYQNGKIVETHDLDTNFEGKDVQEKYEYYQENEVPAPKGGKSVFDGPAESIAQSGPRVEGSPDEFAGEAENIGGKPLDSNNPDSWVLDSRGTGGKLNQETIDTNKKLLSTNGAAEEMARRAGVNNIAGTQDANTINLESTEQFLNEKQNILNKTFYNIASWSNDYNHARWDHVKLIKMDELARPEHEFASRGEAKSVARLLTKARDAGIDYHGKTADQLVNEIVKKGLVK